MGQKQYPAKDRGGFNWCLTPCQQLRLHQEVVPSRLYFGKEPVLNKDVWKEFWKKMFTIIKMWSWLFGVPGLIWKMPRQTVSSHSAWSFVLNILWSSGMLVWKGLKASAVMGEKFYRASSRIAACPRTWRTDTDEYLDTLLLSVNAYPSCAPNPPITSAFETSIIPVAALARSP